MRILLTVAVVVAGMLGVSACNRMENAARATHQASTAKKAVESAVPSNAANIVDINVAGLTFEAPDTIPAGWVTFRLHNQSGMIHFAAVEQLPEGIGVKEQQEQVAPVFQQGMDMLAKGDTEAAQKKFDELPAWFGKVVFLGGPGLTSSGQTSQVTVNLQPGTYMLECYVKTDGTFHSYNPDPNHYGMVHQFTVTDTMSDADEPAATDEITVSSADGIKAPVWLTAGEHVVAIHFADQKPYANFVGHDVHLVRLEDNTDMARLQQWMDWTRPHGLETPAPAEFLGGTEEMPAGSTAYFNITLEPGHYAWIAEIPESGEKGMLRTFNVTTKVDDGAT